MKPVVLLLLGFHSIRLKCGCVQTADVDKMEGSGIRLDIVTDRRTGIQVM
jgi:hypothetical protein